MVPSCKGQMADLILSEVAIQHKTQLLNRNFESWSQATRKQSVSKRKCPSIKFLGLIAGVAAMRRLPVNQGSTYLDNWRGAG